eukprot:7968212-Alexandrium_andersonii.AAC.1
MSASLVGSEMCIRDRCWLTTGTPLAGGPCVDPAGPRGAGRDEALGSRPVSYTHLTLPTICSV